MCTVLHVICLPCCLLPSPWDAVYTDTYSLQVDHMTKLMLDGSRDESDDKENRKGNRRETWAPGLAGAHIQPASVCSTS